MIKKHKKEMRKIWISSPMLVRTRCKFCKGFPVEYYRSGCNRHYLNHRDFIDIFSWVQKNHFRLCNDYYLSEKPSEFHSAWNFAYSPSYKSYNPILHSKKGVGIFNDVSEYLVCECGKTAWVFKQKAASTRAEIFNRKSDREYPKKFKY